MHEPEKVLGFGTAQFGSRFKQSERRCKVVAANGVRAHVRQDSEDLLKRYFGQFSALFGRLIVPSRRLDIVPRYAMAILVYGPKVDLGVGVALLCGLPVPQHRLDVVLWHAVAVGVHDAEADLGVAVALLGQRSPLAQRRRIVAALVGRHALVKARPGRGGEPDRDDHGTDDADDAFHDDPPHRPDIMMRWLIDAGNRHLDARHHPVAR